MDIYCKTKMHDMPKRCSDCEFFHAYFIGRDIKCDMLNRYFNKNDVKKVYEQRIEYCPLIDKIELEKLSNNRLTIDNMLNMVGEPVWVIPIAKDFTDKWESQWSIVQKGYIIVRSKINENEVYKIFLNNYKTTWIAYKQKPE